MIKTVKSKMFVVYEVIVNKLNTITSRIDPLKSIYVN